MDEIGEYMRENAEALSDIQVRLAALEKVFTSMAGVGMETDPSRLPVVVMETTPDLLPGLLTQTDGRAV